MARSKSSARWMNEHVTDEFVRLAQKEGYRSRAVYKLKELDEKYRLFRPGQRIVDLGAAPGSWSEYVVEKVGERGRVIALDVLPMDALAGVEFIQGDFQDEAVLAVLLQSLGDERADLVISDMAPNMSGMDAVDIPRAMYLVELAHELAKQVLRRGGVFICKLFQGEGSDVWLKAVRADFGSVVVKKPKASRSRSREVYVVARDFKG
ncbi:MAG TPA: 23S rRNA (uridine(2552)-2'-O)-methyltransferase RlmE [Gammaproteobacteria bacterium]|nr:23S rRNA (uridine(2552)-2'-O)-methyltransferase RlmE [Gammaproteobacteria bacterium]